MPDSSLQQVLRELSQALKSAAAVQTAAAAAIALLAEQTPPASPTGPVAVADETVTVSELAKTWKRSRAYVSALCKRGAIRAMRDGRGYRISRSAVAAYERKWTRGAAA